MSDGRESDRLARLSRQGPGPRPSARNPAFLGRVTSPAPAVGKFAAVVPRVILGVESEGSAGSATDAGSTPKLVYMVGPGVPATGDEVLATFVDWRWVASRAGTSGTPGVACGSCTYPTTLYATIASPSGPLFNCYASNFPLTWYQHAPTGLTGWYGPIPGCNNSLTVTCAGGNPPVWSVYYMTTSLTLWFQFSDTGQGSCPPVYYRSSNGSVIITQ